MGFPSPVEESPASESELSKEDEQKLVLLCEMGFEAQSAKEALAATKGSVERAADRLFNAANESSFEFVNVPHPEPDSAEEPVMAEEDAVADEPVASPVFEHEELLSNLLEMGFEDAAGRDALMQTNGAFKEAVKLLVKNERD